MAHPGGEGHRVLGHQPGWQPQGTRAGERQAGGNAYSIFSQGGQLGTIMGCRAKGAGVGDQRKTEGKGKGPRSSESLL